MRRHQAVTGYDLLRARSQARLAVFLVILNAEVKSFVNSHPDFTLRDTWSIYADEHRRLKAGDFEPNHLHLNTTSYALWKAALMPILEEFGLIAEQAK